MRISDAAQNVTRLFLDTAPIVYYIEKNPKYFALTTPIFDLVDKGTLTAVLSPVTLAECLVGPYRSGLITLQQEFLSLLTYGRNILFSPIDHLCSFADAELRARYNLNLLDAMQVAVALNAGCEALLTNDAALRRVAELRILVVDDLEL